jgi:hypothetical protein
MGEQTIVYFIKANNYMKIGITDDLDRRKKELQHAYPNEITVIHCIDMGKERCGGKRTASEKAKVAEEHLHLLFQHTRQKGEWFKITPFMMDYVGYIADHGFWTDDPFVPFLVGPSK